MSLVKNTGKYASFYIHPNRTNLELIHFSELHGCTVKSLSFMENIHDEKLISYGAFGDRFNSFIPEEISRSQLHSSFYVVPLFNSNLRHVDNYYIVRMSRGARQRYNLFKKSKGLCHYCDRKTSFFTLKQGDQLQFTKDHVIPSSKNGRNHSKNLVGSCRSCNELKGGISYSIFVKEFPREKLLSIYGDQNF